MARCILAGKGDLILCRGAVVRLRHLGTYSHSLAAGTVIDQMMRLYIDSQLDPRWLFEQNFSVILIMSDMI